MLINLSPIILRTSILTTLSKIDAFEQLSFSSSPVKSIVFCSLVPIPSSTVELSSIIQNSLSFSNVSEPDEPLDSLSLFAEGAFDLSVQR